MGFVSFVQLCRADVQTYCFGLAASMGAFLLTAGTKGKRYSMPNARIMIHQPLGGASGQVLAHVLVTWPSHGFVSSGGRCGGRYVTWGVALRLVCERMLKCIMFLSTKLGVC